MPLYITNCIALKTLIRNVIMNHPRMHRHKYVKFLIVTMVISQTYKHSIIWTSSILQCWLSSPIAIGKYTAVLYMTYIFFATAATLGGVKASESLVTATRATEWTDTSVPQFRATACSRDNVHTLTTTSTISIKKSTFNCVLGKKITGYAIVTYQYSFYVIL